MNGTVEPDKRVASAWDKKAYMVAWRAAHRAERQEYQRKWYAEHRDDARAAASAWAAAHPAERKTAQAAWYASHRTDGDFVARNRRRAAAWSAAHPERVAEWKAAHREGIAATYAAYRAAHLDAYREHNRKAKALRRGARACDHAACRVLGPAALAWQVHPHVCYLCGTPVWQGVNLHMDHVIPVARDGVHCADNLRPACASCNHRKGARLL